MAVWAPEGDHVRVTVGVGAKAIAAAARLAGAALVLLAALPSTATAGEARAVLTVTATVVPACSVEHREAARHRADVSCSTGATVTTRTAGRHDERPLDEAAAILGTPLRRSGGVVFTGPVRSASASPAGEPGRPQYLTITY
jgi:hypothetical protein